MIITHSLPPHVNDFYEKLMMSKCPLREKKGRMWTRKKGERRRKGGGGGSWLGTQRRKVGVVFPVNTELQRVRGERLSRGYAEEHAA